MLYIHIIYRISERNFTIPQTENSFCLDFYICVSETLVSYVPPSCIFVWFPVFSLSSVRKRIR